MITLLSLTRGDRVLGPLTHQQYTNNSSNNVEMFTITSFTPATMLRVCERQCSTKALEKWRQMIHTIEKYGDIGNFSGVTYVTLPFVNLKFVGTWAPTAKMIGDIPDFNVLNVPKMPPRHNPGAVLLAIAVEHGRIM